MYELIRLSPHDHYIQCPAKVGVVRTGENTVCLIDSGSDKDAAKKVRRTLEQNTWQLQAVYNTHSHADHIGGNAHLQQQTGCAIYAPGVEAAFTRYPILEPSLLYGGCPTGELRHKFLMAQPSDCLPLTAAALPDGWQYIDLAGHAMEMAGFLTPDGTAYIADCLSSRETLQKYRVGYIYDVGAYLQTLEKVKRLSANVFVPSHAEPTADIVPLAQYNIDATLAVAEDILQLAAAPITFETLLQQLFIRYELAMTAQQHALVGSTVRGYLAWLQSTGRMTAGFENDLQVWQRV